MIVLALMTLVIMGRGGGFYVRYLEPANALCIAGIFRSPRYNMAG